MAAGTAISICPRGLPADAFDRLAVAALWPRRGGTSLRPVAREHWPFFITILAVVKLHGAQVREGVAQVGAHNGVVKLP